MGNIRISKDVNRLHKAVQNDKFIQTVQEEKVKLYKSSFPSITVRNGNIEWIYPDAVNKLIGYMNTMIRLRICQITNSLSYK